MTNKETFVADYNAGMSTKDLSKKYKLSKAGVYSRIYQYKKQNVQVKEQSVHNSMSMYRTIKFPDGFIIAVSKKSTSKLVINEKGNVLIIND